MRKGCLVRITSRINHDFLKKGDQYMGLLRGDFVQFVLQNGYPTGYNTKDHVGELQFDIEPLSNWFCPDEFECDFGQSLSNYDKK